MKRNFWKKFTSIVISVLMLLCFATPSNAFAVEENDTVKLQILATSDLHGRFEAYDYAVNEKDPSGSLTQLSTMIKELREENPNTILVDNGDTIQDNSSELFLDDSMHPMLLAMNEIGYDTWTLGNHEFNFLPKLDKIMKESKAKVLCGNVYKPDGERLASPYTIVEKGGVKVGIIGMVTPNIVKWDSKNLEGYKVTNPIDEVKEAIKELSGKVDVMIAVVHMGEDPEYDKAGSGAKELAEACPELTAIVAGHAHSKIEGDTVNGVLITEPYKFGKALSKIDLTLSKVDGKYKVVDKSSVLKYVQTDDKTYEEDKDLLEKLEPYHKRAVDDANTQIGTLEGGDLVPADEIPGIPTAQIQDTPMIDFINKVQMYYGNADVSSVACFRSDANMKEGIIKKSDVSMIYKYDNTLEVLKVTGAQLKKYMEWSAQYYNTYKPGDVTISFNPNIRGYNYDMFSGVKYDIDISKEPGNRIVNLTYMDGTPVKDTDEIKLAVNNYRASTTLLNKENGLFKDDNVEVIYDSSTRSDGGRIKDFIRYYITDVAKGKITASVDNNWKIIGADLSNPLRDEVIEKVKSGDIVIPKSEDGRTDNVKSLNVYDLINQGKLEGYKYIDVLTVNDFHGALSEGSKDAGIKKLVNEIKKAKKENPNTIFVSGGDMYQGSAMSNLMYGKPVVEAFKEAGLAYSAVGNHEYDWGADRIANWAKEGNFEFLAANIYDKATNKPVTYAKPYAITDVDGVKVAFIGLATPETADKTKAENVKDVEFKDPVEILPQYIKEVRDKGAQVVIALTHLGAYQDYNTQEITGEAADLTQVEGLDAVVSAHTHTTVCGTVNNVPIVQAYKQGRAIGKLRILYDTKNDKLVSIIPSVDLLYERKETLADDADTDALMKTYEEKLNPILEEKVATTTVDIPHDRGTSSLMGEFTCDIMRKAAGTQIAIQNGGGLRVGFEKGDITVGDMYQLMPFDNTLVTLKLTGEQLKQTIENGIGNPNISFGQVGGLYVKYDLSRPFGDRVTAMALENGEVIQPDKYYSVVVNDFMITGGDGYTVLAEGKDIKNTQIPIRDCLIDYLKAQKTVTPVYKGYQDTKLNVETTTSTNTNAIVYVVKKGDCLWLIGKKFGVPYTEIGKQNNIKNLNLIFIGQKLTIPVK